MPQTALRDARTHLELALDRLPALEPGVEHPAGRSVHAALAALDAAARRLGGDDLALSRVADGSVSYPVDELPVLEAITHPAVMPDGGGSWDEEALLARVAAAGSGAGRSAPVVSQAPAECANGCGGHGDGGCGCGCCGGCEGRCGDGARSQPAAPDSEGLLRILTSAAVGGHLAA